MELTYTKQAQAVLRYAQGLGVRLYLYSDICEPPTSVDFWRVLALALAQQAEFQVAHVWTGRLRELQEAATAEQPRLRQDLQINPVWGIYGTHILARELDYSELARGIQECLQSRALGIERLWGLLLLHQYLLPGELYVPAHEVGTLRDICQFPSVLPWPDYGLQPVWPAVKPLPQVAPSRYRRRLY